MYVYYIYIYINEKRLEPVCDCQRIRISIDENLRKLKKLKIEGYKEKCVAFLGLSKE
jgi:hypothetical protein